MNNHCQCYHYKLLMLKEGKKLKIALLDGVAMLERINFGWTSASAFTEWNGIECMTLVYHTKPELEIIAMCHSTKSKRDVYKLLKDGKTTAMTESKERAGLEISNT